MFDYVPDYACELIEYLDKLKDGEVKSNAKLFALECIYRDIAEEYSKTHSDEEKAEKNDYINKKYSFVSEYVGRLYWISDDRYVSYIIYLICEILDVTERECSKKEEECKDFMSFIKKEIPEIYEQLESNYKKNKGANEND